MIWVKNVAARVCIVVDEVAVRHVDDFLCVKAVDSLRWRCDLICHYVVDEVGTHWATESHELDLDWGGSEHEHVRSLSLCPPIQVKENVDILLVDKLCQFDCIQSLRDLYEFVTPRLDRSSILAIVRVA